MNIMPPFDSAKIATQRATDNIAKHSPKFHSIPTVDDLRDDYGPYPEAKILSERARKEIQQHIFDIINHLKHIEILTSVGR